MNIAPKSPLFPLLDKKLSLNDEQISSFDSFNTKEQPESSNYTKSNATVVGGEDAALEDIKLSEFDLDFDVWNTVIDETQEENVSTEDRFSTMAPAKLTHSSSTISSYQEQFTFKTEQSQDTENEGIMKIEENEMAMVGHKNEMVENFSSIQGFSNIPSPMSTFPATVVSGSSTLTQDSFNCHSNDSLASRNKFNIVQSQLPQYSSADDCVINSSLTNQQEPILHPQLNQKQPHRIKVNFKENIISLSVCLTLYYNNYST